MEMLDRMNAASALLHSAPEDRNSHLARNDVAENLNLKTNEKLTTILHKIQKNKDRTIFDSLMRERSEKRSKTRPAKKTTLSQRTESDVAPIEGDAHSDEISKLLNFSSGSDDGDALSKTNFKKRGPDFGNRSTIPKKKKNEELENWGPRPSTSKESNYFCNNSDGLVAENGMNKKKKKNWKT